MSQIKNTLHIMSNSRTVRISTMEHITHFQRFPDIGEKILHYLDLKTLKNCEQVCQSWKSIMDNPLFWLKKLKSLGQPIQVTEEWYRIIVIDPEDLILKKSLAVHLRNRNYRLTFGNCIYCRKTFELKAYQTHFIENHITNICFFCDEYFGSKRAFDKHVKNHISEEINEMPIMTAIRFESMEILRLLEQMDFDFDKQINGTFPVFNALKWKRFEALKFLNSKMKNPLADVKKKGSWNWSIFKRISLWKKQFLPIKTT